MASILNCFTVLLLAGIIAQGYSHKVRLCVTRQVELNKCNDMNDAAKKHGLNDQFECLLDELNNCILLTKSGKSDAVVVDGHDYSTAKAKNLTPVLFEAFGDNNVMVAIADPDMTKEQMKQAAVEYDENNMRASHAAMYLNHKRGSAVCGGLKAGTVNTIKIVKSTDLEEHKNSNKKLICPTLERKDLNEFKNCNIEANLVNAIFVPKAHNNKDEIISAFKSIVEHFGPSGAHNSDFKIFGKYKEDDVYKNDHVIFSDDAIDLLNKPELPNQVDEHVFDQIHCHGSSMSHDHHHHSH